MNLAKGLQLAAVAALSVATVVLVVLAMTRTLVVAAEPSVAPTPSETAAAEGEPEVATVSVLGDEHVLREGSWFYRAVPAEPGSSLERGALLAEEGASVSSLEDLTDQILPTDIVLVAVGAVDVAAGETAPMIMKDIRDLLRAVRNQDAKPVLVLVPPSDDRGFLTKLLNRKIQMYAERRRTAVIDIYSDYAEQTGKWLPRFTDDGEFANEKASEKQAAKVARRLEEILQSRK